MRVAGNQLVDGNGRIITLHGANISGTEFVCATVGTPGNVGWGIYGGPVDQLSTYQAMRTWKINAVRVPLNEDCWLGINGINPAYSGANYRNAIINEVQVAEQGGMIVILDLHWSAPGTNLANGQDTMANMDHSPAFWASVAGTFKNNHGVIFDLYNEPHPHDSEVNPNADPWGWDCWINGCLMNTGWQAAGMQTLVNAVRGTGAQNPVLVNGNGWGNDDSEWLTRHPNDPANQMIAGLHSYPGQGCVFPACWTNSNGPISPVAAAYPLIVGETGDSAAGPITYINQELPFLDSVGVSYLAWTWNPWGNPDDVLIQDWSGTPTTGEGAYYRAHLQATF